LYFRGLTPRMCQMPQNSDPIADVLAAQAAWEEAAEHAAELRGEYEAAVARAHNAGYSYTQIGQAIGVSRQNTRKLALG
jgi:DNA-directed RNA polymerase specialized sigma24 family protein